MCGSIKFLAIAVVLLVGGCASAPQTSDILSEYPNGAFNDPVPNNENNQQFHQYANYLTRFDEWVTGKKVPIPADPATDALHQDLPPDAPNFNGGQTRVVRAPQGGNVYANPDNGHAVFKREETTEEPLISDDKNFGDNIEDKVPATTEADPKYGEFIKELKRFDPYQVGHSVEIPKNATADEVWKSETDKQ